MIFQRWPEVTKHDKCLGAWKRVLEEGGMDEYGVKRGKPLSDVRLSSSITVLPLLISILQRNTKIAIIIMPTIFFYVMFMTLTILPWYTGIVNFLFPQ